MNRLFILLALLILQCVCIASGYYLPGVSPHTYQEVEPVLIFYIFLIKIIIIIMNHYYYYWNNR